VTTRSVGNVGLGTCCPLRRWLSLLAWARRVWSGAGLGRAGRVRQLQGSDRRDAGRDESKGSEMEGREGWKTWQPGKRTAGGAGFGDCRTLAHSGWHSSTTGTRNRDLRRRNPMGARVSLSCVLCLASLGGRVGVADKTKHGWASETVWVTAAGGSLSAGHCPGGLKGLQARHRVGVPWRRESRPGGGCSSEPGTGKTRRPVAT